MNMPALKAAYAAAELAGLPGMPATKSAVIRKAEAEGWAYTEETGRGGRRRLYPMEQLPATTQAALKWSRTQLIAGDASAGARVASQVGAVEGAKVALQQDLLQQATDARQAEALKASAGLDDAAQRRMDAKLWALKALERHVADTGAPYSTGEHEIAVAWRLGRLQAPQWVRDTLGELRAKTLQRWRLGVKTNGITHLAGNYGNRRGDSKVNRQEPLRAFVEAMLVKFPHARATHVMQALRARMAADVAAGDVELPSIRSLERWIEQWRQANKEVATALANPDAWKNKFMVAMGSQSEGITEPNQKWELDSSPADVMLTDGRHSIIGVVDVGTRRLKLLVSKSSKATAVAALVRLALLDWGVPETAKTDNGSDYTSKHITRVFGALDVKHDLCAPFQPWQKPHIERAFGTFTRDLVELLAGFIGHNVAERSAIEARTSFADRLMKRGEVVPVSMTATEFQDFCDRWTEDVYQHRPHSELGCTPFEAASRATTRIRTITDERALDILLAEAPGDGGYRTVQKQGVRVDDAYFIAPELEGYVGQRVMVRYDAIAHDLGRVFVFGGPELQFVCVAECPERTGLDRREVAIKAREMQKRRVQEERRALKEAARKVGVDDIAQEILRDRAKAAGKLTALPRPTEAHTSAGLTAAAEAAAEAGREQRTSADVLQDERVRALWERQRQAAQAEADAEGISQGNDNELARRRAAAGVVTPQFDDKHQRAQWVLKQERTRALTGEERGFLAAYKAEHRASYQLMVEMVEEMFSTQKKEDPGATGSV